MKVKDLIYLLQSKTNPEDEVYFTAFIPTEDDVIQVVADAEDNLNTVFKGDDGNCYLDVGDFFIEHFFNDIEEFLKDKTENDKNENK